MKHARPYQIAAIEATQCALQTYRSTLLVMSTGTGKTFTGSEIIKLHAGRGLMLWLAHREELITQAHDAIVANTGLRVGIEKAERRAQLDGLWGAMDDVIVASVQTLASGDRLKRFEPGSVSLIFVDEAHHATSVSYRKILDYFPYAQIVGLTATPDRGDGVGMGNVFESVAYEYDIRRAITEGFLAPITQKQIVCADLDLSKCRTTAGDLNAGDLEKSMMVDKVLHQVADPLVREAGDRSTIIFTVSVDQAHSLVEVLGGYTNSVVRAVDGTTPYEIRRRYLAEFASGECQFIANCGVLTEGFDAPRTRCVAVVRPTKSRALYTQMLGRGTRLFAGKDDCLVLDFTGNSGKHKLITPLDVLAGKPIPDDVRKAAEKKIAGGMPSEEALAQSERESVERADPPQRPPARKAKATAEIAYRAKVVNPFGDTRDPGYAPRATEAQVEYLRKLGVEIPADMPSAREASKVIDALKKRREKGLCTHKQAKMLAKMGLNPDVPFATAHEIIDAVVANRWRVPEPIRVQYGLQQGAAA
jgi:superfamily II DNA or RNA helicase